VETFATTQSSPAQVLGVLRNFSEILTHSLDAEAMLKQFLLLLREMLGINRAAIFLREPATSFAEGAALSQGRRLRSACAVGLSAGLLEHFELSFDSGIGGQLLRLGRILKRDSQEARNDSQAQKEFELLSGQVAVPILDRETVIGVGVFDGRVTGEPLVNAELEIIFHLLEQLALGIKNIWLHDQLAGNHELMAGILRELSSACLVVNHDLAILHANKMARKYFGRADQRGGELEFSDLPPIIGSKIYQVLKAGSAVANFKYEPDNGAATVYNLNIVPFQKLPTGLPASVLLMAEDLTQSVQFQRLEIEAANLRLVKSMADRLTHEIGNALVPLSTHQQLLAEKWKDAEFRASLDTALAEGVKRVARLTNQMRFLAQDAVISADAFPVAPLIEEAFQEARKYQPVKAAQLKYETGSTPIVVTGNRAALKHALSEVMLNALQANPTEPKIGVRLHADLDNGKHGLHIEVQDNGSGFSAEAVQKAAVPFFTTRNVGLGLGLTVTRKIVENHHGKLEILSPKTGHAGVVRISLPLDVSAEKS
jgi:signal transduction histidine kinase